MAGLCFCFFALVLLFFPLPSDQIGEGFLVCYFSLSFSSFIWFLDDDGMEREACVCDHGFERSDLCAEIIIIIIIPYLHAERSRVTRASFVSRNVTIRETQHCNTTRWCCGQHVTGGAVNFSSSETCRT